MLCFWICLPRMRRSHTLPLSFGRARVYAPSLLPSNKCVTITNLISFEVELLTTKTHFFLGTTYISGSARCWVYRFLSSTEAFGYAIIIFEWRFESFLLSRVEDSRVSASPIPRSSRNSGALWPCLSLAVFWCKCWRWVFLWHGCFATVICPLGARNKSLEHC